MKQPTEVIGKTAEAKPSPKNNHRRWAETYPDLGTGLVPLEGCLSPEQFEREREHIFKKVWLNVGRVEDVPHPGSFIVQPIAVWGASILVARGKDGVIRAFHNVCPHRANKLFWESESGGRCDSFVCKFHGWSFSPEGKLIGVPDEECFHDFRRSDLGLVPVGLEVWEGFIFVHLDPKPKQTLRDYLGEFGERLQGYPFGKFTRRYRYATDFRVNWKVGIDAFQEAYHALYLHRRSLPGFAPPDDPMAHPLWIKLYDQGHRVFSCPASPNLKATPAGEFFGREAGGLVQGLTGKSGIHPGTNPTRSKKWAFDINVVFPFFFIDVLDTLYFTYNFWPIATDRTFWEIRMYYPEPENAAQVVGQEYSKCLNRDVMLEDLSTLEETELAMKTRAVKHFVLSDAEICVRHQYKVIDDYLKRAAG